MTWIQTYTGLEFNFMDPDPSTVCVEDIAHALSRLCRFTGHTPQHYSVAQHSVLVSQNIHSAYAFEGLMHDAAEAYVGDVSAPAKIMMRRLVGPRVVSPYDRLEQLVWRTIARRFKLPFELHTRVKTSDLRMLMTEKKMLGEEPRSWGINVEPYTHFQIVPWPAEKAEQLFLSRFHYLYKDHCEMLETL